MALALRGGLTRGGMWEGGRGDEEKYSMAFFTLDILYIIHSVIKVRCRFYEYEVVGWYR